MYTQLNKTSNHTIYDNRDRTYTIKKLKHMQKKSFIYILLFSMQLNGAIFLCIYYYFSNGFVIMKQINTIFKSYPDIQ